MARARNIKASFFQNEQLGELQPLDRLFFIGLWTVADFKGCLEFRPKRLKVQILPYDDCNIEEIGINLEKSGLIASYSVLEKRYIKILNFIKHQNPHKNEKDSGSDIPDIDSSDHVVGHVAMQPIDNIGLAIRPDKIGCARADSLNLIPENLNLIPENKQSPTGSVSNQPNKLPTIRKPEKPKIDKSSPDEMFSQFYSAYPRKASRPKAEKAWSKINPDLYQKIIDDISYRSANDQQFLGEKKHIPYPATYLNDMRWEDEIILPANSNSLNKADSKLADLKNAMTSFVGHATSAPSEQFLIGNTTC